VKNFNKTALFIIALLVFGSCAIERKVAKDYLGVQNKGSILLFVPDWVIKTNLRPEARKIARQFPPEMRDSIYMDQSLFLGSIQDSAFLVNLVGAYINELKGLGFRIYTQAYIDLFMGDDSSAYIVNLTQLELEEYIHVYTFEDYVGSNYFSSDIDLNALNCNAWFEINKVNETAKGKKIFFDSHFLSDDLHGNFRQNVLSGDVRLEYQIDTLQIEEVYDFAKILGEVYASYTFDFILNNFISTQIVGGNYKPDYLHYDKASGTFKPAYEERFEEMAP
jgi:hypothetical protein